MRKKQVNSRYQLTKTIRSVLEFIFMVYVLNYTTVNMESIFDALINADFFNPQTNQREIFYSMNVIHLVQKAMVFCLCGLILKCAKVLLPQRTQQCDQLDVNERQRQSSENFRNNYNRKMNQSSRQQNLSQKNSTNFNHFSLTRKEQIFLGVTTFICLKMFVVTQSRLNVIYIIISKYSNILFVIIAIHFVLSYVRNNRDKKLCSKSNWKSVWEDLSIAIPLGVGTALIKLLMTEIPSYFRSYAGKSPQQPVSFSDYFISVLNLLMDHVLYIGLFLIKEKYSKNTNNTAQQNQKNTILQKELQPIILLNSWKKYALLLFLVNTIFSGELYYSLKFISHHPQIITYLVKISLYYFVGQLVACRVLLKYRPYVYFTVMTTRGMFGKTYYYLFKNFNLLSVPYYLALLGFYLILKQIIQDQNQNKKIVPFILSQSKQSKEYDSVDNDQKNIDYQWQGIDSQGGQVQADQDQGYP